jgi:hypothetical protein
MGARQVLAAKLYSRSCQRKMVPLSSLGSRLLHDDSPWVRVHWPAGRRLTVLGRRVTCAFVSYM